MKLVRPSPLLELLLLILFCLFPVRFTRADSAAWNLNPASNLWSDAANWTPATVPNGPNDTATFDFSNTTGILTSTEEVNGIVFDPGATPFTIKIVGNPFTISGTGVTNNSGLTQKFAVVPSSFFVGDRILTFSNGATAGNDTDYTAVGSYHQDASGGEIHFEDNSSAGSATIRVEGGSDNGAAVLFFEDFATAANATIINYGGARDGANGGFIDSANGTATAGDASISSFGATVSGGHGAFTVIGNAENATIATYGGSASGADGAVTLVESSAGNATFTTYGGTNGGDGGYLFFGSDASLENARFEIFDNGTLDFSNQGPPNPVAGSIEGNGLIILPAAELVVGHNGLTTIFSGTIQSPEEGFGSLTKVGSDILTLTGANTYSAGTLVSQGSLVVSNNAGSGTGSGPVQVDRGVLGGSGIIAGDVTIGGNPGSDAFIAPAAGTKVPATLTILSSVTLNPEATYSWSAKGKAAQVRTDQVIANGVTIDGATFSFHIHVNGILTVGGSFTVINNTAATPITGTFSNLPDGGTITVGNNTFQASYEGGDGNDLTLTVVP